MSTRLLPDRERLLVRLARLHRHAVPGGVLGTEEREEPLVHLCHVRPRAIDSADCGPPMRATAATDRLEAAGEPSGKEYGFSGPVFVLTHEPPDPLDPAVPTYEVAH